MATRLLTPNALAAQSRIHAPLPCRTAEEWEAEVRADKYGERPLGNRAFARYSHFTNTVVEPLRSSD
jgi:hypothetical protein